MNVPEFMNAKAQGRKLSVLTAYDCLWAAMLDEAGIDALLVGDSMGMVFQGQTSTLPVTLEQMIYHGEIVCRATKKALVIVDLPFMSYQVSSRQAVRNAGKVLKETGCGAVKLEGGVQQAKTIERLAACDLPVMAHVGMRPQSVRKLGKMSAVQRDEKQLLADAVAAERSGAFAIVLELIPAAIAQRITETLTIPTIGIGAGPHCDGQVLVTPDMFGLTGFKPKFMKLYADLKSSIIDGAKRYAEDIRKGEFPTEQHSH
ncbi:3-methyl-2-oxobutanoate hydroxymethyltransferase [Planctomicrobium piriforme]|uniref:3-methyl-2-oxobutanoate hydroxymethyltransferase n=1 Tax=Planctomicrobium piriforme TaxID=1576369 RepID=A0A1I3JCI7_9PLAN|nr:3-methyl-2-oxobutanoate hydroxymethyltransferase [Planctomicrobium piriforme]SFI57665.1 3-methyl-2-oxobutanoate hydroxymethyltransferase [Planctomicrobium piriforme]